jgi:hypothetical protein
MIEGVLVWLGILVLSALIGSICGSVTKKTVAVVLSGAIPWFGLLSGLLYSEYFLPYQGGGASMWPVAQLFGGTVAAATGIGACRFFQSKKNPNQTGDDNSE